MLRAALEAEAVGAATEAEEEEEAAASAAAWAAAAAEAPVFAESFQPWVRAHYE